MTLALLTLNLLSIAAIGVTVYHGIHIPEGGGAFGRHFIWALVAATGAVFTHTMTYFYFVGMGSNLRKAIEEHGKGKDYLLESRRLKAKVLPWAFFGMLLLMTTFILGGGAHTRAIPSWIHNALGYLSLGASGLILLIEAYYLLRQNSLVNAYQRELTGSPKPEATTEAAS